MNEDNQNITPPVETVPPVEIVPPVHIAAGNTVKVVKEDHDLFGQVFRVLKADVEGIYVQLANGLEGFFEHKHVEKVI